jgi:Tfp pilus assembly protein PilF
MHASLSPRASFTSLASLGKHAALVLATVLLGACSSTPRSSDESLAELCAQRDLSKTSQRVSLAGGYHALAKKDLVCAERLTLDARQKDMKDPYAALNLGAVYQRTGRIEQARELYSVVLELDGLKNESAVEAAHLATRDQQVQKRPAEIARHNLALLQR